MAVALCWTATATTQADINMGVDSGRDYPIGRGEGIRQRGYNMLWKKDYFEKRNTRRNISLGEQEELQRSGEEEEEVDELFSVITANVLALNPRIEEVLAWDAHLLLLQETKLTAHAMKDVQGVVRREGWTMVHGKPCPPGKRAVNNKRRRTSAANEATRGGVAALIKGHKKPIAHPFSKSSQDLVETARWQRVKVPMAHGARCLTASTLYGISGAATDARKKNGRTNNWLQLRSMTSWKRAPTPTSCVGM